MELTPEQQKAIEEQKQYCPFCKLVKGEIPSSKVYEDDTFLAVLDINPATTGHVLLMPKEHYPILPLVPPTTLQKLANLLAEMSAAMRKSMVSARLEGFIANGAAAGQQTSHFLVHLIPGDKPRFMTPSGTPNTQLEQLVRARYASQKELLARAIEENPELRRMIIEQPDELVKNLPGVPDLQKLFKGVDIHALSRQLRAQGEPRAVDMDDKTLVAFINNKDKLRKLLVDEPDTLEEALSQQPKLKAFFEGTSVAAVRDRYLGGGDV